MSLKYIYDETRSVVDLSLESGLVLVIFFRVNHLV